MITVNRMVEDPFIRGSLHTVESVIKRDFRSAVRFIKKNFRFANSTVTVEWLKKHKLPTGGANYITPHGIPDVDFAVLFENGVKKSLCNYKT